MCGTQEGLLDFGTDIDWTSLYPDNGGVEQPQSGNLDNPNPEPSIEKSENDSLDNNE